MIFLLTRSSARGSDLPYIPSFSLSLKPPFQPDGKPRLVSIDVEMWERNHRIVTEVGVAILDTNDIVNVAPKETGEGWFPLIKAQHFRIWDYMGHVNHHFVAGCPEKFNFG